MTKLLKSLRDYIEEIGEGRIGHIPSFDQASVFLQKVAIAIIALYIVKLMVLGV